jgi:hypothetical protein
MDDAEEILFCDYPENRNDFPCENSAIEIVSLGIATACVALLFVIFLFRRVRTTHSKSVLFVFVCMWV